MLNPHQIIDIFIVDFDEWNEVESLSVPRHEAGCSFSSELGMVISGGYDDLTSTEYTMDGDKFETLSEPMPVGKNEHCLVALDGGDLFVTGWFDKLDIDNFC